MKYYKVFSAVLLLTTFGTHAQTVLVNNNFGTDLASLQAATVGWGVAEMDGDGHGWRPYLSADFQELGFTGIVDASATFIDDGQGNITELEAKNLVASPPINLSGYSSVQLTYKIGALLEGQAQMGYYLMVVQDNFIDFFNPDFTGAFNTNGSQDITLDLTPFIGQTVSLVWYHEPFLTYGNGYLILDDIVVTATNNLGIDEILTPKLSVYPNPASDRITISGLPDNTPLSIFNISGQKLKEVVGSGDTSIDISTMPAGVFFIKTPNEVFRVIKK